MALVVDEIVDIVEERLQIELASAKAGVLGSAVIKGQATEIIDIAHYLPMAFEDWLDWRRHARPEQTVSSRAQNYGVKIGHRASQ